MSSASSSGLSENFERRGSGIPRNCMCGRGSIIKTADTLKNPERLFYCCPFGSKEDNRHLFKWTNIAMVEEMEEVESVVKKIQVHVRSLEAEMESLAMETRTCEAVSNSYGNEIQAIKTVAEGCEKEIGELKENILPREGVLLLFFCIEVSLFQTKIPL